MEYFENAIRPEKAVLAAVDCGEFDCSSSLYELEELAKTAGAVVIGVIVQRLAHPVAGTYFGSGRLLELKEFCENNEADTVIVDGELSPVQQKNIEDTVKCKVIDRTTLILDIFAQRANSNEGKLQVELAQLRYSLPRLTGSGARLSRLGGGIGTRGPGETKLESDKRHIRKKIQALEEELEELEKRRRLSIERREKDRVESVAIVGYTNAGKSTLLNYLTGAGVLAQDKLFATLDPTCRALTLPDGRQVMLIDTVGFIRRLPHHLVEAFKSTLEIAASAKVLINVCDASDDECAEHLDVTAEILKDLECENTPLISVFNKCDKLTDEEKENLPSGVCICAKTGEGIEELLCAISKALPPSRAQVKMLFPYDKGGVAAIFRNNGNLQSEEYLPEGLSMTVTADIELIEKYKEFCV